MQILQQGEEYEEEEFDEELLEDEAYEDTEARVTSLYGIPIKTIAIVGAGVLVVLLIAILFATRRSKSKSEDLAQIQQQYEDDAVEYYDEEMPVVDDGTPIAESTDSGEMVYNPDTGLWESASAVSEPVVEETATDDERVLLRSMGYSGDEIDYSLRNGFSVQALVDAAQKLYDDEADKALRRMSDSASEEFRYIIDNTYFSQVGYEFEPVKDLEFGTYDYTHDSYTVNADYVKCPTYGAQLQLKCRVARDLWLWYIVTPERWETLPDEGNIVLRVNYTKYGVNTYVTSISETDPTLDTIDSSASSLDTIVGEADTGNVPVEDTDVEIEDIDEDVQNETEETFG